MKDYDEYFEKGCVRRINIWESVGREECWKINAFIEWIECANNFNLVQL